MAWLVTLLYVVSLVAACITWLWTAAFLGFAGEAHRSGQLTIVGRLTAIAAHGIAVAVIAVIGWLLWRRLFTDNAPAPAWLPPLLVVVAACSSFALVKLFDGIAYVPKGP